MAEATPATTSRILLMIDGGSELRGQAQRILEAEGFVVDLAPDAPLDELKLLADKPDLVILDLTMAGVDGFKFLESVKQTLPNPPAVVFLSGGRSDESVLRGVALGAFAFLPKPVDFKTLVETCHAASRRSTAGHQPEQAAERRAHPRRPVLVAVQLVPGDDSKGALLGEMTELSAGGASVISVAELPVGATVHVMADPRVFPIAMPLTGEVRSVASVDTGFRHGIEFVDLDPEMARLLKENLAPASPEDASDTPGDSPIVN